MANWRSGSSTPEPRKLKQTEVAVPTSVPTATESAASPKSWKGKSAKTGGKPFWMAGAGKRSRPREMALFILGLGVAALAAGFAMFMTRGDYATPCIAVTGLDFESPWMPNSWAQEDAQRMESWFAATGNQQSLQCSVFYEGDGQGRNGSWQQILDQQLDRARPGGPGGTVIGWWKYKAIVVYLSAHGVVQDGRPSLVFSNNRRVDFAEVLSSILKHPAHANTRLLLVVDSGRQLPDARLAVLTNNFVEKAQGLVTAQSRPNLAVLFSASDHQIAWPAPELDGTIFGTGFTQGMLGMADINDDNRINVTELANYVSATVDSYASTTRDVRQQPILAWSHGSSDFQIAYCRKDVAQRKTITAAKQDASSLSDLKRAWDEFEPWRSTMLRAQPWLVAKVRDALSNADQFVWAGAAYSKNAKEKIDLARQLMLNATVRQAKLAGSTRFRDATPSPRFNLKEHAGPVATTTATADSQAPPVQPTFADSALQWLEQPLDESGKQKQPPVVGDFEEAVVFCWWWLKQNPRHWSLQNLTNLLQLWPPQELVPQQIRQEEAIIMAALQEARDLGVPWGEGDPEADELWPSYLKRVGETGQQLYVPLEREPRALSSVRGQIEVLSLRLRAQRDALHARRVPSQSLADSVLQPIAQDLRAIVSKLQVCDDFADKLALAINWPLAADDRSVVQDAMESYDKLSNDLSLAEQPLRDLLDSLQSPYVVEVHTLAQAQGELSPRYLRQIHLHLWHRPIQAVERAKLHDNLLGHFASLPPVLTDLNSNHLDAAKLAKVPESLPLQISMELLAQIGTLIRQEITSATSTDQAADWKKFVTSIANSSGWWDGVGGDQQLLNSAARKVRLCANWSPTVPIFDAARLEEEIRWQDYLLWRAQGCIHDFWRTPLLPSTSETPYFALCAKSFIDEAAKLEHSPKAEREEVRLQMARAVEQSLAWANLLESGSPKSNDGLKSIQVAWNTANYPPGTARLLTVARHLSESRVQLKQALPVGVKSELIDVQFALAEEGQLLAAFRGHAASARFKFAKDRALWTLANRFVVDPKTTVLVESAAQPAEVVFALDCSGSFSGDNFRIAKQALIDALDNLKDRDQLRIALVVFGHSRNFPDLDVKHPEKNSAWDQLFPKMSGDRFDSDAIVLEGLAPATSKQVAKLNSYLERLAPFGATPLYLAIERSKELLDKSYTEDPAKPVQRRVILITDGKNDVQAKLKGTDNPSRDPKYGPRPEFYRTILDVERAFAGPSNAQLDVVHIGKGVDDKLKSLSEKTNGKYKNTDFDNLPQDLFDRLEPLRHSIVHRQQRTAADVERALKFREEWIFRDREISTEGASLQIIVTEMENEILGRVLRSEVASKDIFLVAGDQLIVRYVPERKQFIFPYDRPTALPLKLGAHLQAWRLKSPGNSRDIRFVLDQQDPMLQTIRPAMVFLEVAAVPLSATTSQNKPKAVFWTSDVIWESRTARPTCRVTIDNGPHAMDDSALPARLWIMQNQPANVGAVELKDIGALTTGPVREIAGVKVTIDGKTSAAGYELVVTTVPNKVERLVVSPPAADWVKQEYFAGGRVAYHYHYSEKPSGQIQFFAAPSDMVPVDWLTTGWVETEH